MCVKEIFTDQQPDGRLKTWSEGDYCSNTQYGKFCDRTKELHHPPGYRRSEPRYGHGQLPPTPPLSYHSDHTSDSERSSKRRSGIYINDQRVIDVNRKHSSRHERHGSGDRIVYVGSSPLSRTPPLYSRSIPSSPVRDAYDTYEPSYRDVGDRSRSRERPTSIKVEIINERPKSSHHRRQGSSSKTASSRDSNEEERRQRRHSDLHHGDQTRQRKKESEIARQNEAIASRTPVPQVPSSPRYRRGSVAIIPPVPVQERMRAKEEEVRERELEAQKQRLKDRFKFKSYHHS
ncbi:hypothetical protein GQX73_g8723 [Xylaria multiplex]|uniref:Uncharacterized protein n=1 Tax=Xylaria multiplex TaxID=323545 RepID=A0A7C8IJ89_9PEZI|nr:hypothetical protein GQX73_g8723 [Xylaria multiplex]